MSPVQSVTLRGRFATSTVRGFAVARRNVYARESIRNNLIMYFLVGFMFQQLDRLQILAENDHFECRRERARNLGTRRRNDWPNITEPRKLRNLENVGVPAALDVAPRVTPKPREAVGGAGASLRSVAVCVMLAAACAMHFQSSAASRNVPVCHCKAPYGARVKSATQCHGLHWGHKILKNPFSSKKSAPI